jgi:hypothetical protein
MKYSAASFLFVGMLFFSFQSSCQWDKQNFDTLTSYRTPFNVRLYLGEIKLTRQQGLEAIKENKSTLKKWLVGSSISTVGFATAGAGVALAYVALKGETITAPDITGKLVTYKARDQVLLGAGLLSFVVGASMVQVGVDKKMEEIRRFNKIQRSANQEKVTLNFGLQGKDKIGFTVKIP